ncbi:hypothetical protein [Alteromonas sp. a30]|uniref:hypothetical protein n=1 Tax=Alteromonas sp. a30 TaxID=2730917 RepID=UPI002281857A|nr:hypothetical protein [Alteromonas sp. a30]MCY7294009.1 hypothetical protein [Alteromonas sp. a30]
MRSSTIFILIFLLACIYSIYQNRYHVNIVSLLTILLGVKTAELTILKLVLDTSSSYVIFSSFFLVDIPAIVLIALRVPLCRFIEFKRRGKLEDKNRFVVTNADLLVGKIYITYCIINLLALIEHAFRHLEDFGFPADAEYTIFLYENFRVIWSYYEYVKHTLNIIEFIAVFATISSYMRSERILKA